MDTKLNDISRHSQETSPAVFLRLVTMTFDLLTQKQMNYKDSSWNISKSSLVILTSASVFQILCGKSEGHTDKRR